MNCQVVLLGFPLINKDGLEVLNVKDTPRYMRYMDYLIGQVFIGEAVGKGWTISDLGKPELFEELYAKTKVQMKKDYNSRKMELSPKIKKDLVRIVENWDIFAAYHSKYNAVAINDDMYESITQSTDGEENEQEGNEKEEFDSTGNDKSTYELASPNLKLLFRLLPKLVISNINTLETVEALEPDGLPSVADFSSLWNNLAMKLAGKKSNTDFIATLTSPEIIKVFPEITVLNQLLNLGGSKSKQQVQQFAEFYKVFSRPIIKLYMTKRYGEGEKTDYRMFPQLRGNRDKVRDTFISNFISENIPAHLLQYTIRDGVFNELRIKSLPARGTTSIGNVNFLDVDIPTVFKQEIELLSLLGIKLSGIPLINSYDEKKMFVKLLENVRDVLYPNMESRLRKNQLITSPITDLSKSFDGDSANSTLLNKIINIESYYSTLSPTLMTKNSKGEPQSDLSNDNAITMAIYDLNTAKTLTELYTLPSFKKASYSNLFKASKAIEFLFDKDGNKAPGHSINVINYNGADIEEAKVTRDLSELEKRIVDFNNMLEYGVNDIMRTETSNSFYALQFVTDGEMTPHYRHNSFSNTFSSNENFMKDMVQYLEAELARIKQYNASPATYATTPNYGKFSIFSEILSPELQQELLSGSNYDKFYTAIDRYFQPQVDSFVNKLMAGKAKNVVSSQFKATPIRDLAIAFLANSFITNVETSALLSGESLFYKDMAKRLKGLASTGAIAANLDDINVFLNENENEKAWKKLYSISSALKAQPRDNSSNFKTQVLQEAENNESSYTQQPFKEGVQASIKLRDGKDITMAEVDEMLKDGNAIKVSDGQGRISMDFHRELSFRFGFWTPELETAYEYEGMYYRKANNLPYDEEKFKAAQKAIFSQPERYAIPVLKVTYFGNVENDDVKVDAKAYDKFSLAPLIPSFIKGHPVLNDMNTRIVKNQLGYVKYESATKLFVRNVARKATEIGKDADIYTTPLLKEQLKTSIRQKEESSIPTQFSKLLVANLFNQGKGVNNRVQKAYDDYVNTLLDIQKEHQVELLDSLGYKYDIIDGKPAINGFSPERLFDKVQVEVSRQKMSSNVSRALEVNRDANGKVVSFKYSPEATGVYAIINDYIAGIIDKSMRRYKVNSADFVLLSPADIDKKLKYYKYNEAGTRPAECKITLTSSFINLLNKTNPKTGQPIGDIDTLNSLLKDDGWVKDNEKSLTVVFSRPPVGGPNSMGHTIVQEFLPPTMGNVLMLPDEFIAKAGIDFDIDKEKTIIPLLTKGGEYVSHANMEAIKKEILRLEGEYPELREHAAEYDAEKEELDDYLSENDKTAVDNFINRLFQVEDPNYAVVENDNKRYNAYKAYFAMKGLLDNSATNRLLEHYIPILSLPELFADLVIPNSTNMVKPLAAQNAKDFGRIEKGLVEENGTVKLPAMGKVYEYDEQLRTMQSFFSAKSLLGGFAVDNTFQQLNTQSGLEVNKTYYNIDSRGRLRPRKINMLLFSPEERREIERGNRIIMSNRFNLDNKLIQYFNTEFINSTVDSAKDLYFSELNITWRNIGVFNMLKDIGLAPERARDFINSPIILKYLDYRTQLNSKDKALSTILHEMGIGVPERVEETALIKVGTPGYSAVGKVLIKHPTNKADKNNYFEVKRLVDKINPFGNWKSGNFLTAEDVRNEGRFISGERLRELKDNSNYSTQSPEEKIARKNDYVAILANFVEFENHAQALSQFRRQYNYDTTKISSSFEVTNKDLSRDIIKKRQFIPDEYIDKMDNKSIISAFINNKLIGSMFSTIFSITNSPIVQSSLATLYSEYSSSFGHNDKLLAAMPKQLNNEFLRSVVDNLGVYEGKKVIDYSIPLITKFRQDATLTLVDRLTNIRKLPIYATLVKNYSIFNNFVQDIGPETGDGIFLFTKGKGDVYYSKPNNIRFIRNSTEIQSETEGFIEQFRRLLSPDLKIDGISEENTKRIQKFVKDILIAGYFQSGFSKTYQGYNDLIPTEFVIDMYQEAINKFAALGNGQKEKYMSDFYAAFKRNNANYFPKEGQKEARRGKNYRINIKQDAIIPAPIFKGDDIDEPASTEPVTPSVEAPVVEVNEPTIISDDRYKDEIITEEELEKELSPELYDKLDDYMIGWEDPNPEEDRYPSMTKEFLREMGRNVEMTLEQQEEYQQLLNRIILNDNPNQLRMFANDLPLINLKEPLDPNCK